MTTDGTSLPQRDELRALAEAAQNVIDPAWPRRAIQQHGACDGCALTRPLVAAYDDPDRENEPWLCRECADEADFRDATSPDVILALLAELDRLDLLAARRDDLAERVARVEALADEWESRPWHPGNPRDDCAVLAARRIRAALTSDRADAEGES